TRAELRRRTEEMSRFAVDAYVRGGDLSRVDGLLRTEVGGIGQRLGYLDAAHNSNRDLADQLAAATQSADRLREQLSCETAALAAAEQRLAFLEAHEPVMAAAPDSGVLTALRSLVRLVAGADELASALRDAVGRLGTDLGWDAAFIWRRERANAPLSCVAAWTNPNADLGRFETASWQGAIVNGTVADAFEEALPAWVCDLAACQDSARNRLALNAGLHTAAVAPITRPSGVDGVIEVLVREPQPADAARLEALTVAGTVLGDLGHLLGRASAPRWSTGRR
ncbi:MAG TPA: hypothetical protein VFZ89_14330, partial [Solirubrobacteraceae bacterium]